MYSALAVCMGKAASLCSTRRAERARPKWVSSWFPGWWSRLFRPWELEAQNQACPPTTRPPPSRTYYSRIKYSFISYSTLSMFTCSRVSLC